MGNCCNWGSSSAGGEPEGPAGNYERIFSNAEAAPAAGAQPAARPGVTVSYQGAVLDQSTMSMDQKYELKEVLGMGSTSMCYLCVARRTGQRFACKVIDKRTIEIRFRGLLDQFRNEVAVLRQLSHPNIIRLEDVLETEDRIYMVTELCEGGELFDYIVERGTLSEPEASLIVRKITSAVAAMHAMDIIHRDLKPENLLIVSRQQDPIDLKVIDFGLSRVLEPDVAAKSFLGTRGYLAPEMLRRESYDKSVDTWALGVIVYVLLCGCLPFEDDGSRVTTASTSFTLRFPQWAQNVSPSAKDLLRNLLEADAARRYTAEEALRHPWVQGVDVDASRMLESPRHLRKIRSPEAGAGAGAGAGGKNKRKGKKGKKKGRTRRPIGEEDFLASSASGERRRVQRTNSG